jgi:DNA-binding transcriptional ArsR family regulator
MEASEPVDAAASRIAFAIGEPARARILYCLLDGRARASTELSAVADVGTSTASAHLDRLLKARLHRVAAQGRYRYYSLAGPDVGGLLEGLSAVAGGVSLAFIPRTPDRLRAARTCYDHMAGSLGVALHDRLFGLGWISAAGGDGAYAVSAKGRTGFADLGVDVAGLEGHRRRLAFACLDWSERRSHIGGALGAALLELMIRRKWLRREIEGRALEATALGRREFPRHFGIDPAGR